MTRADRPLTYFLVAYTPDKANNHCNCCFVTEKQLSSEWFGENRITRSQNIGWEFEQFVDSLEPDRASENGRQGNEYNRTP